MTDIKERARTTAVESSSARTVDMKFEIVVIPVSDVDRAKQFYGGLGWRLDADFAAGNDYRVIQFTPPGSGCSVIFGKNVTAAAPGSAQGTVPDRLRHRGRPQRTARSRRRGQRGIPRRRRRVCRHGRALSVRAAPGQRSRIPSIAATARSPRSAIRTATAGCFRKSPRDCPAASTRRHDLHIGQRSGERASARGGRPWRAREADRQAGCGLAGLVCRLHRPRAGRQGTADVSRG